MLQRMFRRVLSSLVILAGCSAEAPTAVDVEPADRGILGVERLGGRGPMYAAATERFRLKVDGVEPRAVSWSSSAGEVITDGDEAVWTLPDAQRAYLIANVDDAEGVEQTMAFSFDVTNELDLQFAVNTAAQGEVAPGPDSKSYCTLDIDAQDRPHVTYLNTTHRQLWYAVYNSTAWDARLVDGPGFDIGGIIDDRHDLFVTAAGVPHIVYHNETDGRVWYATLNGNSWIREPVSNTYADTLDRPLAIAIDPTNGRPVIAWSHYDGSSTVAPVIAYRTGAAAWTEVRQSTTSTRDYFLGGLAIDGNGTAWLSWDERNPSIVKWTEGAGFHDADVIVTTTTFPNYAPIILDSGNEPIVTNNRYTYHRIPSGWLRTAYTYSTAATYDIDFHNGQPRIALVRGSILEMLTLNSESYWLYEHVESVGSGPIGFKVDSSGIGHTCSTRGGEIWFD